MADIVDPATRSRMMAGIKGKNTKPEIKLRKALHRAGFRYRLHPSRVPGKPDIVLPKWNAAIFVHGCFWHGHDCPLFRLPGTRTEFWKNKIDRNRARDQEVRESLIAAGWRHLAVWECAFRGRTRIGFEETVRRAIDWIRSGQPQAEIRGGK